jgi:glycosyltransferase involved in cell wall biosynthesis
MSKVVIIYRTIPQYRIEFYNLLKQKLSERNIDLQLIYGDNKFKGRNDSVSCNWAIYKRNYFLSFKKLLLIWQPCLKEIRSADLVIVEEASKLLLNYYLMLRRRLLKKKFAFWGHGINFQLSPSGFFNRFKLIYINQANWWFAYTQGVKSFLTDHGVKESRITNVQNAIDTRALNNLYHSISQEEVMALRTQYNINQNEKVFIYCGALTKEKNIDFLVAAVDHLHNSGYAFKLLIIGNGPEADYVKKMVTQKNWIIYTGSKFGREKALHFRLADLFLLPGAMGLAILDSFAFETPMVTINYPHHGPEFEYIINNENAMVTNASVEDYSIAVADLISHDEKLEAIKRCSASMIHKYNIENMVHNFTEGIEMALLN